MEKGGPGEGDVQRKPWTKPESEQTVARLGNEALLPAQGKVE